VRGPFYHERPFALSLARVHAACERAERIEKVGKLLVVREAKKRPTGGSRRHGVPITRHRNSEGASWYLENDAPYLRRMEGTSDAGEERGSEEGTIKKEAYELGADNVPVPRAERSVRRDEGRPEYFAN